jgi:hypothetical protein
MRHGHARHWRAGNEHAAGFGSAGLPILPMKGRDGLRSLSRGHDQAPPEPVLRRCDQDSYRLAQATAAEGGEALALAGSPASGIPGAKPARPR